MTDFRNRRLTPLLAALVLALAAGGPVSAAEHLDVKAGESASQAKKKRLSQNRYYTMKPFTLPLMRGEEVVEHFTLVIAMEIATDDGRPALAQRVPRIRDHMYQALLRSVTFRRRGSPIPDIESLKMRLYKVAVDVAGTNLVKDVLVQQAFKRPVR